MPVVTTLMARGAFPDSHPQHLGMPGMHGTVAAVAALQKSDLIISLGARFDDRVTGNLDSFAPGAKVIHADIDPAEIGKNRHADVPIVGDVREVLLDLLVALKTEADAGHTGDYEGWVKFLEGVREHLPARLRQAGRRRLAPQYVIERLGAIAGPDAIYTAGVGQHQMWAAHYVGYEKPQTRGSTPAASGPWASRCRRRWAPRSACPDKVVWAIDGDGCFQMTNQELATCAINDIPIKVAIINNESLGMVRQWQTLFYNERYSNTDLHSKRIPDFVKLADAYGCVGLSCDTPRGRRRHHQQGDGDQRRPGGRRLPGAPRRDGLADGRRRHQQRRHQVRARPRAPVRRGRPLMSQPHPVRPRREQARRPGPDRGAVQPPRLQHRVPRGRPDRARRGLADDDRRQRRGLPARAGHQAAQQAGRGDQDRRARPGRVGPPRAVLVKVAATAETRGQVLDVVQLFRPASSTSRPTRSPSR